MIGAGFGSAIGGWLSDKLGRKKALLLGDVLFTVGALSMAAARSPNALITGQRIQHCLCLRRTRRLLSNVSFSTRPLRYRPYNYLLFGVGHTLL